MSAEQVDSHEAKDRADNRKSPYSEAFKKFIVSGWAPYSGIPSERLAAADWTPARWTSLREAFPGTTLVIPTGSYKVRSSDYDHRFHPHSTFAWVTRLDEDREPDAVAAISPIGVCLYFRSRCPRTDEEFYASSRYGEMRVGQCDSLEEMAAQVGFPYRDLRQLRDGLSGTVGLWVVREADPGITAMVGELRGGQTQDAGAELFCTFSGLHLVKDGFEVGELCHTCGTTRVGFEAVARELPNTVVGGRGEHWVEGVFGLHVRHLGNSVGYDTIFAGGDHANTLHWIRDGDDVPNDNLLLLDAGVEINSLYTADVIRMLPVDDHYTDAQRRVYEAVLAAQEAGIATCRTGNGFLDPHRAAIRVISEFLVEIGVLPRSVGEAPADDGGYHRRWMIYGTSHHLGLDAHDYAAARRERCRDVELLSGVVITVEPGLYLEPIDLLMPEEYRGIGVRIEDDILITEGDPENLSASLPRASRDVEAQLTRLKG